MYSMGTVVNNTVVCLKFAKKVDLMPLPYTHKKGNHMR